MPNPNCPYCNQQFSDQFIAEINKIDAQVGSSDLFYDSPCCKREMTCYFHNDELIFEAKTQEEFNKELYELSDDFLEEDFDYEGNIKEVVQTIDGKDSTIFDINPIVFEDYIGKSLSTFPDDLTDFCFGDVNLPLAPTIEKGAQSLRVGNYKIIEIPHLRKYYNNVNTHASQILYYKEGYKQPIKYLANIGPLMNFEAKYKDESTSVWWKFVKQGIYKDKDAFFDSLLNKELIVLKDEWAISTKYGKVKKITWRFTK